MNPAGALFCMKCGTKLAASCVNCGAELPDGAVFCMVCGHKVGEPVQPAAPATPAADTGLRRLIPPELLKKLESAASSAMAGERRTVTMLFCDLQGSTAAAEHLDPEEWADIMNGAFEHLIAPVYHYEGTLARLMGDAILAFFGAPIGHEDDPERAVRAGLEIIDGSQPYRRQVKERWGIDFDVRVGINTGLVVVGAIGSDLRVEYTAMGDAVNVAARMEQTAAPGTVQISEATRRLVPKLFEFEPLGPVDVKGRTEAVEAHRVLRALERPETLRGIDGLRAPMVGRSAELAAIVAALDEAVQGQGRIVSVTAEAGLGKSRLVDEARLAVADHAGDDLRWIVARALSYESAVPFASVQRLVRRLVGAGDNAEPAATWAAIDACVRDTLPGRTADVAPFLATLAGAPVPDELQARVAYREPGQLRGEAFRALFELIEAIAGRRHLVTVFEDLHWADSASIDFVTGLLDMAERIPIAIVLVFRPRRDEASWTVHETAERDHPHLYTRIELEALDETDARSLVSSLLDIDDLPEPIRAAILAKAEGNPFFMEEVIRSLIDAGLVFELEGRWVAASDVANVTIPDTLAAVVTTRLDRLDDAAKRVAQAGSVLGREFRYDELAAVIEDLPGVDDALLTLQRRDIVREVARVPKRVYRFKHALVQEAVYGTVLLRQRTEMHAAIAGHLERFSPERSEDIADHLLAARLTDRAVPFLLDAGDRAFRAYALREAGMRFERALGILDAQESPSPVFLRRVLESLGRVREAMFDFPGAGEIYERLYTEGERVGDLSMSLSGRNKAALVEGMVLLQRDVALDKLQKTEAAARAAGQKASLAEACMYQCFIRSAVGEFDTVDYYMGEVARLGTEIDDIHTELFGLTHRANTLMERLMADEAIEQATIALAKAEAAGHLKWQAELLTQALAVPYLQKGEIEQAMRNVDRGMEIAMRIGDRGSEAWAALIQGKMAMYRGSLEDALGLFRRVDAATQAIGLPPYIALARCTLGTCLERIGGELLQEALAMHAETLAITDQPMGDWMGTWVWSELAFCALAVDAVDMAEKLFHQALERRNTSMYISRPDALRGMCEVMVRRGRLDEAAEYLDQLEAFVTERRVVNEYVNLRAVKARMAEARGDHRAALALLDEAIDLLPDGMLRVEMDLQAARIRSLQAADDADGQAAATSRYDAIVEEIAGRFRDERLRAGFRASAAALRSRSMVDAG